MAEAKSTPAEDTEQLDPESAIVRDSRFVRISPEVVYVYDRGPDIQLSLIELGPMPVHVRDDDGGTGSRVRFVPGRTEIGRVILAPPISLQMAMQIIEHNLEANRLQLPAFKNAMIAMFDRYPDDNSDDSSSAA